MNRRKRNKRKAKKIAMSTALVGVVAIAAVVAGTFFNGDFTNYKKRDSVVNAEEMKKEKEILETDIVEGKNHIHKVKENAVQPTEVREMMKSDYQGQYKDEKIVFLTFDDGPSSKTEPVLNILKEKDVTGTFFILGENISKAEKNKDVIKRIVDEGNAIGNHTYTHDFGKLYPKKRVDSDYFMEEYKKTENELKGILGEDFKNNLVRLPGGENTREYHKDQNLPEFLNRLETENVSSIDWNALNGDAEGKKYTNEQMIDYVKRTSENKNHVILLMHDSEPKEKTVEVLPEIIDYYKAEGYKFKIIG
ncbi:MAG: polysaccharide deacetylase family protein [Sarcina sp.]